MIQTLKEYEHELDKLGNYLENIMYNPEADLKQIGLAYDIFENMLQVTKKFIEYGNATPEDKLRLLFRCQNSYQIVQTRLAKISNDVWNRKFYDMSERLGMKVPT